MVNIANALHKLLYLKHFSVPRADRQISSIGNVFSNTNL